MGRAGVIFFGGMCTGKKIRGHVLNGVLSASVHQ